MSLGLLFLALGSDSLIKPWSPFWVTEASPPTSSYLDVFSPYLWLLLSPRFVVPCEQFSLPNPSSFISLYIYILSNSFISQFFFSCSHHAPFLPPPFHPQPQAASISVSSLPLLEPSIALQMWEQIKEGGGGGCCFSRIFLACLGAGAGISVSISTRQVAAAKLPLRLGLHLLVSFPVSVLLYLNSTL